MTDNALPQLPAQRSNTERLQLPADPWKLKLRLDGQQSELLALYADGNERTIIARHFHISVDTVKDRLKQIHEAHPRRATSLLCAMVAVEHVKGLNDYEFDSEQYRRVANGMSDTDLRTAWLLAQGYDKQTIARYDGIAVSSVKSRIEIGQRLLKDHKLATTSRTLAVTAIFGGAKARFGTAANPKIPRSRRDNE